MTDRMNPTDQATPLTQELDAASPEAALLALAAALTDQERGS